MQAQRLPNYNYVVNHFHASIGDINSIGIVDGNIYDNLQTINNIDPNIQNLLNQLLQHSETKQHAEQLTTDIVEYVTAEPEKKSLLFEKIFNSAEKLLVLANSYEKIKPIATAAYTSIRELVSRIS